MNDLAIAWLDALRSGKYKQGNGKLLGDNFAYCCLGVACDLFQKMYGEGEWVEACSGESGFRFSIDGESERGRLPVRVKNALGLAERDGGYHDKDNNRYTTLLAQNDDGVPFSEIADIIEAEPEGLFV